MNIIDLRKNLELSPTSQRLSDRRKVPFQFGSPEWLEHLNKNSIDPPNHDRRKMNRRSTDVTPQTETGAMSDIKPYHRIILTPAERTLLEDLYLIDLE